MSKKIFRKIKYPDMVLEPLDQEVIDEVLRNPKPKWVRVASRKVHIIPFNAWPENKMKEIPKTNEDKLKAIKAEAEIRKYKAIIDKGWDTPATNMIIMQAKKWIEANKRILESYATIKRTTQNLHI